MWHAGVRDAVDAAVGTVVSGSLEKCQIESLASGNESTAVMKEAVELLSRSK